MQNVIAVANDHVQQGHRQQGVIIFSLLQNDLGQDEGGHIIFGLGVNGFDRFTLPDEVGHFAQGYIGAFLGVVQSSIGIFFQHDHVGHLSPRITSYYVSLQHNQRWF